ncbi:MAG: anti sigma-E factor RseA C-terminal domain-containing protein, partial [Pseudomonas sp.]
GLSLPQMQVQGPAVLAGYTAGGESVVPQKSSVQLPSANWQEQRLPSYLRQHAQQAAASGADSALPYARAASLENR